MEKILEEFSFDNGKFSEAHIILTVFSQSFEKIEI